MSTTGWIVLGIGGVGLIWLVTRQQAANPGQAFLGGLLNGIFPGGPAAAGSQVASASGSILNSIFGGGNATTSSGTYSGGSGGPNSGNGYYDDPGTTGDNTGGVGSNNDLTGDMSMMA